MHHYLAHFISSMYLAAAMVSESRIPWRTFDPNYMMELQESSEKSDLKYKFALFLYQKCVIYHKNDRYAYRKKYSEFT
jgi:hypothetical protein